jgi:GT2 family glycosyltransferase
MTPTEAGALLTIAAAFDNRKPDADAAKAWAVALEGYRFEDCREAIVAHYRASSEWLMPQAVIAAVKRIRSKRIADHPPVTPPPFKTFAEEQTWRRELNRRIGDGQTFEPDQWYGELNAHPLSDLKALMPRPDQETP